MRIIVVINHAFGMVEQLLKDASHLELDIFSFDRHLFDAGRSIFNQ